MEGIELGIEEIIQLSLIAFTLLIIGGGIMYIADPNHLRAKAGAAEVSYIASMISNNGIVVEITYEDAKISENDNHEVVVNYKSASSRKGYFGKEVDIKASGESSYIISS